MRFSAAKRFRALLEEHGYDTRPYADKQVLLAFLGEGERHARKKLSRDVADKIWKRLTKSSGEAE